MGDDPRHADRHRSASSAAATKAWSAGAAVRRGDKGVRAWAWALWAFAVVAMTLDIALTGVGLSLGLVERNPLARAFIDSVGLLGAGVLLKGAVLGFGYACWLLVPRVAPTATRHRNLLPLGVALPSWVAAGINAGLILSVV